MKEFGKWDLTPDNREGFSGPLDRWPTRLGFDYFRGFLGVRPGGTTPLIAENRKIVGVAEAKNGDQCAEGRRRSRPDRGANRAVTASSTTRRQRNWLKGEQ